MVNYIKKSIKPFFWIIDKINKQAYIKYFPRYLEWLGIQIDSKDYAGSWICPQTFFDSSHYDYLTIGKGVTISFGVSILVHDYSIVHAARATEKEAKDIIYKRVHIGNNVFIGAKAVIMPGVTIGDNCIIGAGAVVRGKCEENSIYAGNPAKRICGIEEFVHKYESLLK